MPALHHLGERRPKGSRRDRRPRRRGWPRRGPGFRLGGSLLQGAHESPRVITLRRAAPHRPRGSWPAAGEHGIPLRDAIHEARRPSSEEGTVGALRSITSATRHHLKHGRRCIRARCAGRGGQLLGENRAPQQEDRDAQGRDAPDQERRESVQVVGELKQKHHPGERRAHRAAMMAAMPTIGPQARVCPRRRRG